MMTQINVKNETEHLYLHVPFCHSICFYCDFCRTAYVQSRADEWLDALTAEIEQKKISPDLRTLYIGGGTPTCLSDSQLIRLLELLKPYTGNAEEYTIEINPETLTETKAEILERFGINRASVGFQTSDPQLLKTINRRHTMEDMKHTMELLRAHGIRNISLDLMYSLPRQTMDTLKKAVDDAVSLKPTHISIYSLTIEENSVFGKQGIEKLDDDMEADMYDWLCSYLPSKGFIQYEISNFMLEGQYSRHNRAYWDYKDFYGISCGASGKEGSIRYDNVRSLSAYIRNPLKREIVELTQEDRMFEMVMMSLRLKQGLSAEYFRSSFNKDLHLVYPDAIQQNLEKGLLEWNGGYLRCTAQGYPILNSILEDFLPE